MLTELQPRPEWQLGLPSALLPCPPAAKLVASSFWFRDFIFGVHFILSLSVTLSVSNMQIEGWHRCLEGYNPECQQ